MAKDSPELSKQGQKFSDEMRDASFSFDNISKRLGEITNASFLAGDSFQKFLSNSSELTKELDKNKDALNKILKGEMDINEAQKLQRETKTKSLKFYNQARSLEKQLNDDKNKFSNKEKKDIKDQIKALKNKAVTSSRSMHDAVKIAEKGNTTLTRGLSGIAGGFKKAGFEKASSAFGNMAKQARKVKVNNMGASQAMKMLGKSAKGMVSKAGGIGLLVSFLVNIVKLAIEVNNEVATIGRSLQVSAGEARKVRQHFVNIANSSDNLKNTYKEIAKAQGALNNALGTSASVISGDILDGMATLQNRMGLSEKSALGFAKAALASKKTVNQLAEATATGALETAKEFGVRVDMNKVLERTGKIQGALRASLGNNFEIMGKLTSKAQLLGMEMQQVVGHSEGLLNFQSSIQAEIKAELILKRSLNLEAARLAAATQDYDTYMDEIVKNAGTFYEFSQMNTFEQKALAGALMMSKDELGNMLLQQEDLLSLQQKSTTESGKQAIEYAQQLSTQQAFNAAIEKLRNILINVVANIESIELPWFLGGGNLIDKSKTIFDADNINKLTGMTSKTSSEDIVGEATVDDFIIKTHPQDTLVMAGGTSLGGNNNDVILALQKVTEAVDNSRSFSYNSFAAVKEERRTTGKFDKKI